MSHASASSAVINGIRSVLCRRPKRASALELSQGQFVIAENSIYDLRTVMAYTATVITLQLRNLDTQPVVIDSVTILGQAAVTANTPCILNSGDVLALSMTLSPTDAGPSQFCLRVSARGDTCPITYRFQLQGVMPAATLDFISDRVYPSDGTKSVTAPSSFNLLVRNATTFPVRAVGYKLTSTTCTFAGFPLMPFTVDGGGAYVLGMVTALEAGSCDVIVYSNADPSVLHVVAV